MWPLPWQLIFGCQNLKLTLCRNPDVAPSQLMEQDEALFSEDDPKHPEWEMSERAQHWVSIGVAVVFAIVLLLDLVAGSQAHNWATTTNAEKVVALK